MIPESGNIQGWILIWLPLVISLIFGITRALDNKDIYEQNNTIDKLITATILVNVVYAVYALVTLHTASDIATVVVITMYNIICNIASYYILVYGIENMEIKEESANKAKKVALIGLVVAIVLLIIFVATGDYYAVKNGVYTKGRLYALSSGYVGIVLLFALGYVFFYRGSSLRTGLSFTSLSLVIYTSIILQTIIGNITLSPLGFTIAMMIAYINVYSQKNKEYIKAEKVLTEETLRRMQLQMKPHFMYNTLSSIQELCYLSPKEAETAIGDFTEYLRGNIDNMDKAETVPFVRELELTKHYINLEKIRFGDRIKDEYNIEASDFMIPAVTLQPIAENAVKYGLCQKLEGGTIRISTKEQSEEYNIIIEDTGAGFTPESLENNKNYIGLSNVKKRLEILCHGSLEVKSEENVGTMVKITIPKKG